VDLVVERLAKAGLFHNGSIARLCGRFAL